MRLLVIHQNFPGQFGHLVTAWSKRQGWDVRGLGRDTAPGLPGFDKLIRYKLARNVRADQHLYLRQIEASTLHGQAAARAMLQLKASGFVPDTILAHPGWGETLFAKDVFPNARLVHLCEWYYNADGADLGFDPEFPLSFDDRARIRMWNAQHVLDLVHCDAAVSPTHWQRSRYPEILREKIVVHHEGIDTENLGPDPNATVTTPSGVVLTEGNDDILTYRTIGENISGLGGDDSMSGALGNDTLHGDSGNDWLNGGAGNDSLDGGLGDDTLAGNWWNESGADTLDGGGGNDEMTGGSATVYLVGKGDGQDNIWQASDKVGNNTLQFKAGVTSSEVTLSISDEDLIVGYRTAPDQIVVHGFYAIGSATNPANPVQQFKFADGTVWSLATIDARVYQTNHAPTLVSPVADRAVAHGVPFSFAISATAFSDNDPGDVLSYAATLADGSALPSWLAFDPASRLFSGAAPASGTTSIRIVASDGVLQASDDFQIVATLQNLTLTGTAAADTLSGGAGNDTLNGAAANDSLIGRAGNDMLDGGTGNDTMLGGTGNDTFVVNVATDVVTELANEGIDTVQSGVTWTLGPNIENLTLTGTSAINGTGNTLDNLLTGNSANNTLTGAAGNDTLDGGTGNDTMHGGTGNDTYVVNVSTDVVTENAGEGTDTIQSAVTLTLSNNNVENLTLTGSNTINGTGNVLDNVLTGNSANNTLTGAAGNDTLDGGLGNDTMLGGVGNDTYVVNVSTDVVTENVNEGTDTIQSAVTLTLGNNVENLTLTGTNAINATGNSLANTLLGNSAANVLTGAAGDDIYDGGAGNDTFTDSVTSSNDTYRWGIGSGLDMLTDAGGSLDHIDLYAGIAKSQLKFVKNANDLVLSVLGQTDKLTIKNWYVGTANQIEEFRLGDGSKVLASEVNGLLSAMAAFVPMDSSISGSETKSRLIDMPISNPQAPHQAWM